jgi:hypothetical protein
LQPAKGRTKRRFEEGQRAEEAHTGQLEYCRVVGAAIEEQLQNRIPEGGEDIGTTISKPMLESERSSCIDSCIGMTVEAEAGAQQRVRRRAQNKVVGTTAKVLVGPLKCWWETVTTPTPKMMATEYLSAFNNNKLASTQKGARASEQPRRRGNRVVVIPVNKSAPKRSRSREDTQINPYSGRNNGGDAPVGRRWRMERT